ncbi:efflux RND transporter periplasmic adaptor subunit [Paenibacillus taiwanensis]|uniref:efflux RND transporter periplasmic adaptor subunit n=1 Tax=Paenibacillus taiwanensis TaxID=401638 RepID=UPI000429BC91|nr:biotin/lipoyl-binding protein [Paenibacillus taiwanensis]
MGSDLSVSKKEVQHKRNIQIAFSVFVAILIIFTLFSNTLESLTLPKVITEVPVVGRLEHTLEARGGLRPIEEVKLFNLAGWKVHTILVKEGDRVKRGQTLITYDSKAAEWELQGLETDAKKQMIELQRIQDQYILATIEGDEASRRSLSRDMESRKLDQDVLARKITDMKDRISNERVISAPFDGVITRLNAIKGLASSADADLVITNHLKGFWFDMRIDDPLLTTLELEVGEKLQLDVVAPLERQSKRINGTIVELIQADPRPELVPLQEDTKGTTVPQQILRVKVTDSALKGNEQAYVKLKKSSQQDGLLLMNKAVHQDRKGSYVYKVEEQRGALSNVFIVRKIPVTRRESNDNETLFTSDSIYEQDRIIMESSEPLQDGNRVRLQ